MNESQLLAEIQRLSGEIAPDRKRPDGYFTITELWEAAGRKMTKDTIRDWVRTLDDAGFIDQRYVENRRALGGCKSVPGYKLLKKPKE
jgi:hypothetical protein